MGGNMAGKQTEAHDKSDTPAVKKVEKSTGTNVKEDSNKTDRVKNIYK